MFDLIEFAYSEQLIEFQLESATPIQFGSDVSLDLLSFL